MRGTLTHRVNHLVRLGLGLAILCALFPTPLLAHVAIFPQTVEAGARHASFYIRAPVEKDIPVVELGFEIDEQWIENGGDLTFQDVPDWKLHVELDEQERLKKVYWTALEEGALPLTFQMIFMRVNVPSQPGVYPFKSWQKYTDGSVVWWNEPRGEGVSNPLPDREGGARTHLRRRPPSDRPYGCCSPGLGDLLVLFGHHEKADDRTSWTVKHTNPF